MLDYTPCAQEEFDLARATIDEGSDIERAWKFHIVVSCSMFHGDGEGSGPFGVTYSLNGGVTAQNAHKMRILIDRLDDIKERLERVTFLNEPATKTLKRLERYDHAVVYVDPPYASATTAAYGVDQQDYEATLDTLKRQTGRVAVSGYNDDWDELGWHRHEFDTVGTMLGGSKPTTEVLWTNYEAAQQPRRLI